LGHHLHTGQQGGLAGCGWKQLAHRVSNIMSEKMRCTAMRANCAACAARWDLTLEHKVFDDTMEDGAVIISLSAQLHQAAAKANRQ
jgi:hypothetical protein